MQSTEAKLQERLSRCVYVDVGTGKLYRRNTRAVICRDGTTLSCQASETHYCYPREDNGPWSKIEVGYPSQVPNEEMLQYCENQRDPTKSIYGYLPVKICCDFIDSHGGFMEEKLPQFPNLERIKVHQKKQNAGQVKICFACLTDEQKSAVFLLTPLTTNILENYDQQISLWWFASEQETTKEMQLFLEKCKIDLILA